jgi:hypothetical protein
MARAERALARTGNGVLRAQAWRERKNNSRVRVFGCAKRKEDNVGIEASFRVCKVVPLTHHCIPISYALAYRIIGLLYLKIEEDEDRRMQGEAKVKYVKREMKRRVEEKRCAALED